MVIYTFGTGELAPYSRFLRGTNLGALIRWIGAPEKMQYSQVVETMEPFEYGGQSRPRDSTELSRSLPAFGMSRTATWKTERRQGINPETSTAYRLQLEQGLRRRGRHETIHMLLDIIARGTGLSFQTIFVFGLCLLVNTPTQGQNSSHRTSDRPQLVFGALLNRQPAQFRIYGPLIPPSPLLMHFHHSTNLIYSRLSHC